MNQLRFLSLKCPVMFFFAVTNNSPDAESRSNFTSLEFEIGRKMYSLPLSLIMRLSVLLLFVYGFFFYLFYSMKLCIIVCLFLLFFSQIIYRGLFFQISNTNLLHSLYSEQNGITQQTYLKRGYIDIRLW